MFFKTDSRARWPTSLILTTWEVQIGTITSQGKRSGDPISTNKAGHGGAFLSTQLHRKRKEEDQGGPGRHSTSLFKMSPWGEAGHPPHNCKVLSSKPSSAKNSRNKINKKRKNGQGWGTAGPVRTCPTGLMVRGPRQRHPMPCIP
jgi:hypothetical protein